MEINNSIISQLKALFASEPHKEVDTKEAFKQRLVVHNSYEVKEYDLPKPINYKEQIDRHVINQSIINKDDYVMFVNEYKGKATKIFYDKSGIDAVFNYSTPDEADYGDSICRLPFEPTEDAQELLSRLNGKMSQKVFVGLLKRMEPYIVALDNKKAAGMDIIEMAESLQGITQVDSIARNTQNKITVDATVRTGKANVIIPRIITFEFPVYKNDRGLTTRFETELFLDSDNHMLVAELRCYNTEQLMEETRRLITDSIVEKIEGVNAFAV